MQDRPRHFTVSRLDGEYAYLLSQDGNEIMIARALLPPEADEGTRLEYRDFSYQLPDD